MHMDKETYSFLERNVDYYNCGQHDMDNSFLLKAEGLVEEFAAWQANSPDFTPIGVCRENVKSIPGMRYFAMVFEDDRGRRYYVHVPGYWADEYAVIDQGPAAMEKARRGFEAACEKEDYGASISDLDDSAKEELFDEAAQQLSGAEMPSLSNPDPEPEPEEEQPIPRRETPAPKNKTEPTDKTTKQVYFTCDARHVLDTVYNLAKESAGPDAVGIMFGSQFIFEQLQKIAVRAAELNDPELNASMLMMHMYDDVPDVHEAITAERKRAEDLGKV